MPASGGNSRNGGETHLDERLRICYTALVAAGRAVPADQSADVAQWQSISLVMRRSLIVDKVALAQMKTDELNRYAGVAQSVEQLIRNQQVRCSSHPTSSKSAEVLIFLRIFTTFFADSIFDTYEDICYNIIGESQICSFPVRFTPCVTSGFHGPPRAPQTPYDE